VREVFEMMILAIDPGPKKSAWMLVSVELGKPIDIIEKRIEINEAVLNECFPRFGSNHHLAIEMVESFGMAVGKEVFETVFWIGRFVQHWGGHNFTRIYRKECKLHLCGNCRAKDPNIRQALLDKIGPQGTKKAKGPTYGVSKDLWSALAVCVTYVETKLGAPCSTPS
jgi:hypothetical protein